MVSVEEAETVDESIPNFSQSRTEQINNKTRNNVASTTFLHPVFNNVEELVIIGRVYQQDWKLEKRKIALKHNADSAAEFLHIISSFPVFTKHNKYESTLTRF